MRSGRFGIDTLFLGGMVLIVVAVIFMAFLKSGAIGRVVSSGGASGPSIQNVSTSAKGCYASTGMAAVLVGNPIADECTCYEQAYLCSANNADITSAQYQTGYSACRSKVGEKGGNAWSYGWSYGAQHKMSQRSCRFYMNSQKMN